MQNQFKFVLACRTLTVNSAPNFKHKIELDKGMRPNVPKISNLSAQDVWPIRQTVLRPTDPLDFIKVDGDETAPHFGVVLNGQVISVISLFPDRTGIQFRKFATLPNHQGHGHGSDLFDHMIGFCRAGGHTRVWCNARLAASAFYQRKGMKPTGDTFTKHDVRYQIMEMQL